MEKERKIKTLSLVALIVAVLGLTVAFAALSQTLTINGTASVNAAEWDIHIESISEPKITGDAREVSSPTIDSSKINITNVNVVLTKPGDSIEYEVKIVNNGTIYAYLSEQSINGYNLSLSEEETINKYCPSQTIDACYIKIIKSMLSESDWDGDGVSTDEEYMKSFENIEFSLSVDGKLGDTVFGGFNPGQESSATLYIGFNESCEEIPKGNVTFNTNFGLVFSQE